MPSRSSAGRKRRSRSSREAAPAHGGRARGAAPVFAALGSEVRLALLDRLGSGGVLSITSLTEGTQVTRQAVTKHLQILAGAGLVRGTGRGRTHVWEIQSARLEDARRWLDRIAAQWDEALGRLKASLEEDRAG
jgi:DNA-binding transcriptional ArsR family regulator